MLVLVVRLSLGLIMTTPIRTATNSNRKPILQPNDRGGVEFTFGYRPGVTGICWIVERSNTVRGYTEIYRYDGQRETAASNVEAQVDASDLTKIIVTDNAPMEPRTSYRSRIVPKGPQSDLL